MSYPLVLTLDMAGLPFRWVGMEEAIMYAARNMVAWSIGSEAGIFHGGVCRATGKRSEISTKCIIALKGSDKVVHDLSRPPLLSRETLFARDRQICAYCGGKYRERELSKDHVIPISKRGRDNWVNVVTACRPCNHRKANRTPEQARMELLYVIVVVAMTGWGQEEDQRRSLDAGFSAHLVKPVDNAILQKLLARPA